MTRLIRRHWRVMFLLLCSLIMISNNTAMAWQMAASLQHEAVQPVSQQQTSQPVHHAHMQPMEEKTPPDMLSSVDHANSADHINHAQHKSCVAQSCCFCLNYQPELQTQVSVSIKPVELLSSRYHQQPLAGHFNNLYRPPCLNT